MERLLQIEKKWRKVVRRVVEEYFQMPRAACIEVNFDKLMKFVKEKNNRNKSGLLVQEMWSQNVVLQKVFIKTYRIQCKRNSILIFLQKIKQSMTMVENLQTLASIQEYKTSMASFLSTSVYIFLISNSKSTYRGFWLSLLVAQRMAQIVHLVLPSKSE